MGNMTNTNPTFLTGYNQAIMLEVFRCRKKGDTYAQAVLHAWQVFRTFTQPNIARTSYNFQTKETYLYTNGYLTRTVH